MSGAAMTHGRPATDQDVLDAPPHQVAELIDGVLHLSPRPAVPHARTATALGTEGVSAFDHGHGRGGPGGWWILFEPELWLGDPEPRTCVLVPDLAGWRRERLPELWWLPEPDLAAEVHPDPSSG